MASAVFPAPSSSGVDFNAGLTASRPAAPANGTTYFNSTTNLVEIYNSTTSAWTTLIQTPNAPVWTTAAGTILSLAEGNAVSVTVTAVSPNSGSLVYSSSNLPAGLSIASSTGVITGTAPTVDTLTTFEFDVTATSGFNSSSRRFNIVVADAILVDFLVVAGGGAGGYSTSSAGGGAGGYRTSASQTGGPNTAESKTGISVGVATTITVGAGGAATTTQNRGSNGSNSVLGVITSIGGGGGATYQGSDFNGTAGNGGSGGGGAGNGASGGGAGGTGTAGQGNNGGTYGNVPYYGGSGGGAGAAGGNQGAAGGAGLSSSLSGTSTAYAGGGGSYNSLGGTGGGGAGHPNASTSTGTANRGGGGGNGNSSLSNVNSGGSGIVIVKIPDTYTATFSGGVTQTNSSAGGFKTYIVTAAGVSDTITIN